MTTFKSFVAACAVFVVVVPGAQAASVVTDLFLANVKANVVFLDQSSKLASGHSRSAAVRKFAAEEVGAATRMASLLENVAPAVQVAAADTVVTGRSAATTPALGTAANGRAALAAADVQALDRLDGRRFDDALWLKQVDALSQLRADYETYAANGDDAVLRAVAKAELPRIEARLLALSKI